MIGRLAYQIRSRFQHGIKAAWYRDVVRPRILRTPPVETDDAQCEVHTLTGTNDWLNLLWALKSFYTCSDRRYALCIHDDGSLSDWQLETTQQHFPMARIIRRSEADVFVSEKFREFPCSVNFRNTNVMAPKLIDAIAFLQSSRMLLIDTDVLFFRSPDELLRRIEDAEYSCNSFNKDVSSAYNLSDEIALRDFDTVLVPKINAGLGLVHQGSIDMSLIEKALQCEDVVSGHHWRIEQTLYALCSSRFGVELLPADYDVFLKGELGDRQSRHYVGAVRHLMYKEGIRKLAFGSRQWSESCELRATSDEKTRSS